MTAELTGGGNFRAAINLIKLPFDALVPLAGKHQQVLSVPIEVTRFTMPVCLSSNLQSVVTKLRLADHTRNGVEY